jgi:hypothetical protein
MQKSFIWFDWLVFDANFRSISAISWQKVKQKQNRMFFENSFTQFDIIIVYVWTIYYGYENDSQENDNHK